MNKVSGKHRRQLALFGSVGLLCTLSDLVLFSGLVALGMLPVTANLISFLIANVQGYFLNSVLTFRQDGKRSPLSIKGYGKFLGGYFLALCISTVIIWSCSKTLSPIGAKVLAIAVTAFWNYCISAFVVFRAPKQTDR